jgi:hypothetical protein
MKYHGKLFGKFCDKYFDTAYTTDEWDAMEKRIEELESEKRALRTLNAEDRRKMLIAFRTFCREEHNIAISHRTIDEFEKQFKI